MQKTIVGPKRKVKAACTWQHPICITNMYDRIDIPLIVWERLVWCYNNCWFWLPFEYVLCRKPFNGRLSLLVFLHSWCRQLLFNKYISTCKIPEATIEIHAAGIRNKYIPSGSVVIAAWSTTAAGFVSGPLMLDSIPNTLRAFRSDVDLPMGDRTRRTIINSQEIDIFQNIPVPDSLL